MSGQNFSVRTERDKLAEIDAIAKAQDRSRNYIVNEALDHYLRAEQQWIAQVNKGLAAAEAGDFASEDEVSALFKDFEDGAQ
jgi:predicted transcriptional regulator